MTLNGVMAVTLCYFNEFGKPAFQQPLSRARKKVHIRYLIYNNNNNNNNDTYIAQIRKVQQMLMSFLFTKLHSQNVVGSEVFNILKIS